MEDDRGRAIWILVAVLGLGGVLVCGGIGAFLMFGSDMRLGNPVVQPAPGPVPGPAPGPGPVPGPFPGPAPQPGPAAPVDPSPRRIVAVVAAVEGTAPLARGAQCEFTVERRPRDDGTTWCNSQIVCAGRLLYGGANAGFYPCALYDQPARHVVGGDDQTTSGDGDAAMRLDTTQSVLLLRDDASGPYGAYSVTANVTSVR